MVFFYSYPTKPSDFIAATSFFSQMICEHLTPPRFSRWQQFCILHRLFYPKKIKEKHSPSNIPHLSYYSPTKRNWLSGFFRCLLDVCVCVVFPAQLFFQNKKPLTLSPPPKKKTQEQILTFNMAMWARSHLTFSSFKVLKLIASHRLSTRDPGEKQNKVEKNNAGCCFFGCCFTPEI